MLIAEYSYEEDIQVKQQEAIHEGLLLSGRIFQAVKKNPEFTNEQIAEDVGCKADDVESTRKMFGI